MKLKILQDVSNEIPRNLMKDSYLIACQHVLPSTYHMLLSLLDLGLSPEKTALFGKCYSISTSAKENIRNAGIEVASDSTFFDSHQPFDIYFTKNLHSFFVNTIKKWALDPSSPLIILDDGGELVKIANTHFNNGQIIFGVEQTTAGYEKLKTEQLNFPVINVARSDAKLIFESPMIAEAQTNRIAELLSKLTIPNPNTLIMGNGSIGSALAQKLASIHKVTCYDKVLTRTDIEKVDLRLEDYDLIIGTTGKTVLPFNFHHQLKKPVTLISASSSDREFDAVHLRRRAKQASTCHDDIVVDGVNLANCGFPINFRGSEEDSVPLSKIQLTIALLFAGVCQTLCERPTMKSFVPLNHEAQKFVLKKFKQIDPEKIFL
jgi:S-adenosylhomocysteine hydrolase